MYLADINLKARPVVEGPRDASSGEGNSRPNDGPRKAPPSILDLAFRWTSNRGNHGEESSVYVAPQDVLSHVVEPTCVTEPVTFIIKSLVNEDVDSLMSL